MATLVFDIETIGTSWHDIDDSTQSALTKWIQGASKTAAESHAYLENVKNQLGLSPLTGSIASVAMYDVERKQGVVYVVADNISIKHTDTSYQIKPCTETELLEDFWQACRSYDVFVTFNGRQFDVPFILHRSVICQVKPTIELHKNRYLNQQTYPYHVDLLEELTFNGAMYRRPSLHLFCAAYDIQSPKESTDGGQVAQLVAKQQWSDLANYNAADVIATEKLYQSWKQYLAPASFINAIEM